MSGPDPSDDELVDGPGHGVTRRQLLAAVGMAGGAGVLLGALGTLGLTDDSGVLERFEPPRESDFSLQGRVNDASVVVLGAGIAGLCCAYELSKAGYRVTVIEAADQAGGRCRTIRGGDVVVHSEGAPQRCRFAQGRWFNPGPARIAQHHVTLDYCRELSVPVEVLVNVNTDAYVSTPASKFRRRAVQADLDGYVSELLAKAVARDVLDAEVPLTERALLLDYLRHVGELGRADRGYRTPPGVGPAGVVDRSNELGTLLRLPIGARLRFERDFDQAAPMFHPVGGMDAIAVALAAAGGADVRTGLTVTRAADVDGGVEVFATDGSGRDQRVRADVGICCVPPAIAAGIESTWPDRITRALAEPVPMITGKIGLEYDRRFWELDDRIFGGITVADDSIRTIWYPSHDYLGNGGVVVGAYPFGPAANRFSDMTHVEREELAVRVGRGIHGATYEDELVSSVSVDWGTQPYIDAGWYGWRRFGVGYNDLLTGDRRWQFAGDWMARTPGWQHGAFESARYAVTATHRAVLASD